ncbi:putative hydrolase [Pseudocercospora fuligena]|uniref:Putative hydrolase n=1 Tax=Pseudocercospora fuligena TaxID=685502 RepID=A0A8H6RK32_9PEZI|nr:putative hydrolase [Pseudocercospora fuligena]
MEKQQDGMPRWVTTKKQRNASHGFIFMALLCVALVISRHDWSILSPFWSPKSQNLSQNSEFDWSTAPTTKSLEYARCYTDLGEYQCARLELPMDYWNASTDAVISLAVIRKPAAVPVTDKRYGGAILLNPGGPGGGGVDFMLRAGEKIQGLVDSADEKYFDLISFDPRGVQYSTPTMNCFQDSSIAQAWQMRIMEEGILGASDAALGRLWSMATAHGGSCSLPREDGAADIKEYMSTASVARDMVSLIEAHGEWREREAKSLLSPKCRRGGAVANVPESLVYKAGKEKIQYWGFSYGSYLGMTYAAMFPDRIERLIVDGVVDAYDYRKAWWTDNLNDTEADMDLFYFHCARAGYPACALANSTGPSTIEGIKNRTLSLIQSLYHNPLPVIGPYPEVVTYSDAKNLIFANLYSPVKGFPHTANLLADIEKGNGTRFAELLKPYHKFQTSPLSPHDLLDPIRNSTNSTKPFDMWGATMAIACTDAEDQSWMTRDQFEKYYKKLDKLSPSIGDMWTKVRLSCTHFSTRAKTRFTAPFEGNTSHPLLFIGNIADPVTPLGNAKLMAKGYEGAGVLTVDTPGHCSLAAKSKSTEMWVKRYFLSGELPPKDTVCEVEELPFGPDEEEADEEVVVLSNPLRVAER